MALLVVYDVMMDRRARKQRRAVNNKIASADSDSNTSDSDNEAAPTKI
jgi:CRISPR/Cas system-associated endoribonuclease Cas2